MVKKCHMRNSTIKQTLSRSGHATRQQTTHQIQATGEQRVHDNGVEMVTTKQDGDEDSFESTEVSASKATESRNEVQKVSEKTPSQNHQKRATNEQSRVAEVTKIETSKIKQDVGVTAEKFYRGQVVTTSQQAAVQVSSSSPAQHVSCVIFVSEQTVASKTDENSTTEAENVDDSQAVSEVAQKIPNTQTRKPHRWRARRQNRGLR